MRDVIPGLMLLILVLLIIAVLTAPSRRQTDSQRQALATATGTAAETLAQLGLVPNKDIRCQFAPTWLDDNRIECAAAVGNTPIVLICAHECRLTPP